MDKFGILGIVVDRYWANSSWKFMVMEPGRVQDVRDRLQSPHKTIWRLSPEVGNSRCSLQSTSHSELKLFLLGADSASKVSERP